MWLQYRSEIWKLIDSEMHDDERNYTMWLWFIYNSYTKAYTMYYFRWLSHQSSLLVEQPYSKIDTWYKSEHVISYPDNYN